MSTQSAAGNGGTNGRSPSPELNGAEQHQSAAQRPDGAPLYPNPYRGIPGYYSYSGYDTAAQEQYWFDYNRYHPYWAQIGSRDGDQSWDETESAE